MQVLFALCTRKRWDDERIIGTMRAISNLKEPLTTEKHHFRAGPENEWVMHQDRERSPRLGGPNRVQPCSAQGTTGPMTAELHPLSFLSLVKSQIQPSGAMLLDSPLALLKKKIIQIPMSKGKRPASEKQTNKQTHFITGATATQHNPWLPFASDCSWAQWEK